MTDDCSKHPENVKGYDSIDELAEEIGKLNYYSNQKLYKKLAEIYKQQAKDDEKVGNKKLSSKLEKLSRAFSESVGEAIEEVCYTCRKNLKNPFSSSLED